MSSVDATPTSGLEDFCVTDILPPRRATKEAFAYATRSLARYTLACELTQLVGDRCGLGVLDGALSFYCGYTAASRIGHDRASKTKTRLGAMWCAFPNGTHITRGWVEPNSAKQLSLPRNAIIHRMNVATQTAIGPATYQHEATADGTTYLVATPPWARTANEALPNLANTAQ